MIHIPPTTIQWAPSISGRILLYRSTRSTPKISSPSYFHLLNCKGGQPRGYSPSSETIKLHEIRSTSQIEGSTNKSKLWPSQRYFPKYTCSLRLFRGRGELLGDKSTKGCHTTYRNRLTAYTTVHMPADCPYTSLMVRDLKSETWWNAFRRTGSQGEMLVVPNMQLNQPPHLQSASFPHLIITISLTLSAHIVGGLWSLVSCVVYMHRSFRLLPNHVAVAQSLLKHCIGVFCLGHLYISISVNVILSSNMLQQSLPSAHLEFHDC